MNIPHKQFCVLPWISLEASPIGTVRPCCLAQDEIVDGNSVKFNLNTADFDSIQNSEYMYQLRQQFLAGKRPATCNRCWEEERAGRTSKRMHTLDRLKHMGISNEWTADAKPLMFLDLKLGNICNLKCRICGSWSSSKWASEEMDYLPKGADKKSHIAYTWLKRGKWPEESPDFWENLKSLLPNIKYFEFTGGEPWMIQEHFELLEYAVEQGYSKNIDIHYNTNATQWPTPHFNLWKEFGSQKLQLIVNHDKGSLVQLFLQSSYHNIVKVQLRGYHDMACHYSSGWYEGVPFGTYALDKLKKDYQDMADIWEKDYK